jgi:lipooligosaccharide transport system permease protein
MVRAMRAYGWTIIVGRARAADPLPAGLAVGLAALIDAPIDEAGSRSRTSSSSRRRC